MKLLFLLLGFSLSAQVSTKILYQSSNFRICEITDGKAKATYFLMTSPISKNSNGLYFGETSKSELELFATQLRLFANYGELNEYDCILASIKIFKHKDTKEILLIDYKLHSDNEFGWIKLTKSKCRSLADEISNNLKYWE